MSINLQIKEKIDGMIQLIAEIDFNVTTLEQFHEDFTSEELIMFEKYDLLHILRHYLWESSILDLCKLFVEDEKFSFCCLLNILVNNYKRISFKSPMTINEIHGFYQQLNDNTTYIKHVKEIRDISIAHKDNKNSFNPLVLNELRTLITIAQSIFNTIYGALYDSDFLWIPQEDKRALFLIKDVAKFNLIRDLVFQSDFSRKQEIPTSDLLKIIDNSFLSHQ